MALLVLQTGAARTVVVATNLALPYRSRRHLKSTTKLSDKNTLIFNLASLLLSKAAGIRCKTRHFRIGGVMLATVR